MYNKIGLTIAPWKRNTGAYKNIEIRSEFFINYICKKFKFKLKKKKLLKPLQKANKDTICKITSRRDQFNERVLFQ